MKSNFLIFFFAFYIFLYEIYNKFIFILIKKPLIIKIMPISSKLLNDRIKVLESTLNSNLPSKVITEAKRNDKTFKSALSKLSSDANYRLKAIADPNIISTDFQLSINQLRTLREVAIMSGADIKKVDELQCHIIAGSITRPGGINADVDVSCCSCCCCCCGETAVETVFI